MRLSSCGTNLTVMLSSNEVLLIQNPFIPDSLIESSPLQTYPDILQSGLINSTSMCSSILTT